MKRILKIQLLFGLLAMAALSSCNKDDGYPMLNYISFGVAEGDSPDYNSLLDNGSRLYISYNSVPGVSIEDGQRLMLNYTILGDAGINPSGKMDYYIRLNGLRGILCKDMLTQTEIEDDDTGELEESLGSDPINLEDLWFAGGFLNIYFNILTGSSQEPHTLNLVWNDLVVSGDTAFLQLRHNAHGDGRIRSSYGYASFPCGNLFPVGVTERSFKLTWTDYQDNPRHIKGTIKRSANSSEPQAAFRLDYPATSVE